MGNGSAGLAGIGGAVGSIDLDLDLMGLILEKIGPWAWSRQKIITRLKINKIMITTKNYI